MYIIIEIQASNQGTVSIVPPLSYSNRNEAEQKYHTCLAAAAVSNVDIHSVSMLNERGESIQHKSYVHGS